MTVSARAAAEFVAFYHAGESASLAHAHHVDITFTVEDVDQNLVADFGCAVSVGVAVAALRLRGCRRRRFRRAFQCDFTHELYRRQVVLAEVSLHRLGNVLALHELNQADLSRFVSITRSEE